MNWQHLETVEQLDQIVQESQVKPALILKHSTRCSISSMAKSRLERTWKASDEEVSVWYLDLIAFRSVSNEIAERFGVEHQSPQILLIKDGVSVMDQSHNSISSIEIAEQLV